MQPWLRFRLLYVRWYHSFCIWSVLCLYLEAFTVEFFGSQNWWRLSTKLSSWGSPNGDSSDPTFEMYVDYTRVIHQLKRLVIRLWKLYNDTIFRVKEKLVLLVLFLCNLIYYRIRTETNRKKYNTNKVIMTKLCGVSCHHPCHQLVCHRLCHQLVYYRLCHHQLWLVVVVVVNGLL